MILTSAESVDRILSWGVRCATTKSLFIDLIKKDINFLAVLLISPSNKTSF